RLGVVTKDGKIIYPDRQLMLFARDVLLRNPGAPILFDVKCSQHLGPLIRTAGGQPVMWKTGHSLVKARMKELAAPLAGEMSGHVFFGERWYGFDDATYTAARLLEILSRARDPSAILNALPEGFSTPELNVACAEGEPARVVERLRAEAKFPGAKEIVTIDWVVEPGFAPLLARVRGLADVIELPLRRWSRNGWLAAATRGEIGAFARRLRRDRYDAVIDLQGLTKSALVSVLARGPSFGLANRTEGASHEGPARWLATHAIRVEPHSHALDRSRELVAKALGIPAAGPPSFGLAA